MSLRRCVQGIAVAVLLAIAPCAAALAQPVITPSGSAFGLAPPPGYAAAADLTGFVHPAEPGTSIVLSEMPGGAYAQITDKRSSRQRAAFEALMNSTYAPDILHGLYYDGDYSRVQ